MTNYSSIRYASSGTTVYADMNALIAATGTDGAQAFVQSNNNIYVYAGSGWYKIATVQNDSPSAITGVDGTYELATDGTATVITAVSTDPEGFPLTWSYSTSGLGSIATVSQVDNVFTITPSTDDANFGTFTLIINATDGVNGAVSTTTNLTLEFIVIVTNSQYTTLLATATGTGDNNDITDSSTNNHTITVTGDAHAGTFSPYRHGGYSTYFDGNGDYITAPSNTSFDLGTGDFTIEAWIYPTALSGNHLIVDTYVSGDNGSFQLYWRGTGSSLAFYSTGDGVLLQDPSSSNIVVNTWNHVAVSRSGTSAKLFVNGTVVDTVTNSRDFTHGNTLAVGAQIATGTNYFSGFITDVRIVKGTAVYTSTFTPPTERLTTIANTSLLTCHLPYIADGSTNNHAITVNGNTSTRPFGPYDYNEYSASDNGGSVYFDGTGDYLSITSASLPSGSSPYTVEAWIYFTTLTSRDQITFWGSASSNNSNGFRLNDAGNGFLNWWYANDLDTGNIGIKSNAWYHVAATWDGTTRRIFVNGALEASDTPSSPNVTANSTLAIGAQNNTDFFHGNISDLRILSEALYTSAFTPPTAPLTAVTNTSLLVSGTDASIIDKSQNANLKLIGNTTGSTTQVKFASTKSIDVTSDDNYAVAQNIDGNFGSGSFTIECWIWPETLDITYAQNALGTVLDLDVSLGSGTDWWAIHQNNNGGLDFASNSAIVLSSTNSVLTAQTWHHIAIVRSGSTLTWYVDGTARGNTSNSNSIGSVRDLHIGKQSGVNRYFKGYMQDVRITKGLARYTANFTPPTEPLKG